MGAFCSGHADFELAAVEGSLWKENLAEKMNTRAEEQQRSCS